MSPQYCARLFLALLASLLALGAHPAGAQQPPELAPEDVAKAQQLREDMRRMMSLARDRVFPALVNINVNTVDYFAGKEHKGRSVGSGVIISPEGHVLTNYHVAQNGRRYTCTLANKREIPATLVGQDPLTDLAVLKIDLAALGERASELPYAAFGDSDKVEVGDTVMAMGSPWALSRSVTRGSVSNTERILSGSDDEAGEMYFDRDQRTGIFNQWIQHDAAINPGNSGGPLVNLQGEVIGINTRGGGGGGDMGFAIPSNLARAVAAELIKSGEVPRSFYGFSLKAIKRTGLSEGVLVDSVTRDSPAQRAGLQAGDVILSIDGQAKTVLYPEQIPLLLKDLADRPIGAEVRFQVTRDGQKLELTVRTEKMERDRGDEAAFRSWGFTGQDITDRMARNRKLASTEGLLVSSISPGGPAQTAEPAIEPGDVIHAVDGQPVRNLEEFIAIYEKLADSEDRQRVLVEYESNGKSQITLIKRPEKEDDAPRELPKAWIGVATQPILPKLAEALGAGEALGFRVTRVYPGTLAAQSELRVGDTITAINDVKLRPRGMQNAGDFQREVRKLEIGDSARLTVLRDGQPLSITVELERTRISPEETRRDVNRDFELTVREMTFFDRDENRWDEDVAGVIVVSVERAGWADLADVRPGDLVQRVGDLETPDLERYRKAMEKVSETQPPRVVFVVLRGPRTHFLFAEPDWKPVSSGDSAPAEAVNP